MYEELIRVLRHCGNPNVSCKGCADEEDCMGAEVAWEIVAMSNMRAAAEAIEELSKRIDRAVELYNRNVERSAMYEALVGIAPEPPKEEAYRDFKPITNYTRLVAKSPKELVEWINSVESDARYYGPKGKDVWLKWLQEVDE